MTDGRQCALTTRENAANAPRALITNRARSSRDIKTFSWQLGMHSLNKSLGFLLNRAGFAVRVAFSQELKMAGMTIAMWRVLSALHDTGHQSLSGLAEYISVEISTLSRQVTTLAGRGLVINRPSGVDWRSVDISLTPAGRAVVQRLLPAVARHERAALNGLDPASIIQLKQLLAKVYHNLCVLDTVLPVMDENDGVNLEAIQEDS